MVKPWDKDKALRMKQLVEAVPRWHARRRWGYDKRGTGHRKGQRRCASILALSEPRGHP